MPEQPAHPREQIERWLGWYGRVSLLVVGVLLVGVGGARGRVLVPLLIAVYWYVSARSTRPWKAAFGIVGGYLAAEVTWFVLGAPLGTATAILVAVGIGATVGGLVARGGHHVHPA